MSVNYSAAATADNEDGACPASPEKMSRKKIALLVLGAVIVTGAFFALSLFVWNDDAAIKQSLTAFLEQARGTPWALPLVVVSYILGGLVFFPIILLNLVVAMVFGLWGIVYGLIGIMANTALYFFIGRIARKRGGEKWLQNSKFKWVDDRLNKIGLAGMVAIHALPAPPFTIMNVIAGISSVSTLVYMLGTFLAMVPGAVSRGVIGESLTKILLDPSAEAFGYLLCGIALWVVLVGGAHFALKKFCKE